MKLVVLVALIWAIDAAATTAANGDTAESSEKPYCHDKTPHADYEQFISISDFKPLNEFTKTYNQSKACAKQIKRFQISLEYASGKKTPFFEKEGDVKEKYKCDTDLVTEVYYTCQDNITCYCPQKKDDEEEKCREILLKSTATATTTGKVTITTSNITTSNITTITTNALTIDDYLERPIKEIMKCNPFPPDKPKEATYNHPLLPGMHGLKQDGGWQGPQYLPYLIFYVLGVAYIFFALAIVCDEYFVPALTVMSHRLKVSDDVAGATFMAAGGSAPELFTNLIGTFSQVDVGFGTIVGSAVFNVLLVIGVCAFFSKEVLRLTWWPLFRDSTYYCACLLLLAILFGVTSPNEITWYEAIILLLLYGGYILLMAFNQKIEKKLTAKCEKKTAVRVQPTTEPTPSDSNENASTSSDSDIKEQVDEKEADQIQDFSTEEATRQRRPTIKIMVKAKKTFKTPYTFRAGILQMGLGQQRRNKAGWYLVTQVEGNVDDTFKSVDSNHDNKIDRDEMKQLLLKLGHMPSEEEVDNVFNSIDTDKDGSINRDEFWKFYKKSTERLIAEVKVTFEELDTNKNGELTGDELIKLLINIGVSPDSRAKSMVEDLRKDGTLVNGMDRLHFTQWIKTQDFWKEKVKRHEEQHSVAPNDEDEDHGLQLKWPGDKSCKAKAFFVLVCPIQVMLYFTIPDVRKDYWKNFYALSFFLSVVWIGVYSYFMVWFAQVAGDILGISSAIMGITVLSAGTSIPDLLSSVIVARQGHGNMAVSSSIGSNLFDILVGLPLPWLAYALYRGISATFSPDGCVRYLYAKNGRFSSPIPERSDPESLSFLKEKAGELLDVGARLKLPNFECYLTEVKALTLFFSLLLLLTMIIVFIAFIACFKWKLTKGLGVVLVIMYFVFLIQDILRDPDISYFTAIEVFGWTRF